MLVTQNIDDLHNIVTKQSEVLSKVKDQNLAKYLNEVPKAFTPHVYEIHGNSFYMHCSNENEEHSKLFY
jgi:NAD-dependent SIR2 family protein deacetylase